MTRLACVLVALTLLAGCSQEKSAAGRDAPVTGTPGTTSPPPSEGPRRVEPEPGLVNVIPTAWEDADVFDGGHAAELTWYSGVEECYGLDHVTVRYRKIAVEVTLFAGARPDAEVCIELAEQVVTIVHFKEPVGDRELVDGARVD